MHASILSVNWSDVPTVSWLSSKQNCTVTALGCSTLFAFEISALFCCCRYLKEIGKDAELINLDLKERQHKTEDFMKVGGVNILFISILD